MNILVLYFSGTGNTAYVAQYIKDHLDNGENEIVVSPMETFEKGNIKDYDLLVLGFPVYACDIPKYVQEYMQDLPVSAKMPAALFCTKAIMSGTAIKHGVKLLEKRGYIPIGYTDINMPGSDGLAFLSKDSRAVEEILYKDFSRLEQADSLIRRIKEVIKSTDVETLEKYRVKAKVGPAGYIGGGLLGAMFILIEQGLKKKLRADYKCIKCGKCEKICPAGNIAIENKRVSFGKNCYLCMRCINQCPNEAIQIGKGTNGKFRWKGPRGKYVPPIVKK